MNNFYEIDLKAKGQKLECKSVEIASDLIAEVHCNFTLDDEWQNFSYVKAVFRNGTDKIAVAFNGDCYVPHEVLAHKGRVSCNLVGYELEDEEIVVRATTYKTVIATVTQEVNLDGDNSVPPTAEEWQVALDEETEAREMADILLEGDIADLETNKQNKLTAGDNITIEDDVISADLKWSDITEKPDTFPPSEHNHDDRYSILSHTHTWDNITDGADAIYDALGLSIVDGKLCVTYEE